MDVVVVGAGISGLASADALLAAGLDVVCLEADRRVGGRLLTQTVAGGALDLGASWFWPGEHRVARLVERLGLEQHEQHLTGDAVFDRGEGAQRLQGNPVDVPSARLTAGAQALADTLAAALPAGVVVLDQAVHAITATSTGVVVSTATGSFAARHVVLAVPPALAATSIEFTPALPADTRRLAVATPVWMTSTVKVVVEYPTPFWRAAGLAGAAISHVGPLREVHDASGPTGRPAALFGFAAAAGGGTALQPAEALAQLARLFGPEALDPVRVLIRDWSCAPWIAPPGAHLLRDHQLFGHDLYQHPALGGRLHWATTETARQYAGHIEGALHAADRATHAVLATLGRHTTRPTALTPPRS